MSRGRRVVLQLIKQTGLGGGRCRGRLRSRQGIENVSSQRDLVGERGGCLVEQGCEEVRSNCGLSRAGFTPMVEVSRYIDGTMAGKPPGGGGGGGPTRTGLPDFLSGDLA